MNIVFVPNHDRVGWGGDRNHTRNRSKETVSVSLCDPTFKEKKKKGMSDSQRSTEALF